MSHPTGLKIEVEMDPETERILDSQSKICNWLYNHLLERTNRLKDQFIASGGQDDEAARIIYSRYGLRDQVPSLKREYPFLKSVHSSPLKNTALRLSSAVHEHQKSRQGKRRGKSVNWPRFRSWKRKWFSLEYEEPWKGYSLEGQALKLSLGVDREGRRLRVTVNLKEPLPISPDQVKALRIVKELGVFYAVFTVERIAPEPQVEAEKPLRVIALDPNHKNLAYGVGTDQRAIEIENLAVLKKLDWRIDELKAKRDRCQRRSKLVEFVREDGSVHRHWEPSRRWKRYNQALQRAYRKRRDQTKTYLYTVANALNRQYEVIGVGDYAPHGGGLSTGMRRAMNNQSLIGRFKRVTKWVARKSGRLYLEFDEYGTTRTCCVCGLIVDGGIPPDVREWSCASCGSSHIRDENAAQNGLRKVRQTLVPGSGLVPQGERLRQPPIEVAARWTWRVTPTGVVQLPGGVTAPANEHRQDELNQERGSS
jgi:putative transposase